ncbi:MAG: GNAT family N-acetyltransferase [Balneola sp.]|nr:GNAT family N-acetyltransferase [Balneola sp.]MBO6650831.1 GNAT family N-acetyltransferase [Balneola sp.]MBO6710060.1 GNAT family N-acetyltransferase [Balneola sp.]MBO6798744.1 GNAT family N-acetyltransferase [Balneola sp.]MBO6869858.1 GNAT family N-acetyltransferase [Balneola sp.]
MIIREANTKDISEILKLNETEVPHVGSIRRKDFLKFLEIASNFIVMDIEGEIAGFMISLREGGDYGSVNYKFFNNHYKKFEYVDRIVIKEEFKGKGLGRKLYEFLFDNNETHLVCCEVNLKPENPDSMAFHEKLGFKEKSKMITDDGKKMVSMLVRNQNS